jgi:tRNA(fMet)-specific endonuclease VapC
MESTFVLDTDTVTLLHLGHATVMRHLGHHRRSAEVAVTIVTRGEILRGRIDYLLKANDKETFLKAQRLLATSEFQLEALAVLPLDESALDLFEVYRNTKGIRSIGRADLLIAAIAVAHRATLVTRNRKHFGKKPALALANWVD